MTETQQTPDCPHAERLQIRNGMTKSMMGTTRLGLRIGARLIERQTGHRPSEETLEVAALNAQMQTTNAIERAGKWAAKQECVLCPGPTNDPMSGIIYCGREVPDEVIMHIARED